MDIKIKNVWLPVGGLITKILEHVEFKFDDEELDKYYTGIRSIAIGLMKILMTKWVMFHKHPNEKESSLNQQDQPKQGEPSIF